MTKTFIPDARGAALNPIPLEWVPIWLPPSFPPRVKDENKTRTTFADGNARSAHFKDI